MKSYDHDDFDSDTLAGNFSYTKQIIVNFNNDGTALALKAKWDAKHPNNPCFIIDGEDVKQQHFRKPGIQNELQKIASTADDVFKIYVIGHGNYGASVIGDKNKKISFIDLAKYLADFVKDKKAVVNLAVCGGARGEEATPDKNTVASFAAKLHQRLLKFTGKNILVVARTHAMAVNAAGKKLTSALSEPWSVLYGERNVNGQVTANGRVSKQPGSKIIITTESGQQSKLDAYYHLWKPKVLKKLSDAIKRTKKIEKQKFLSDWLAKFENMSNHDIAKAMDLELQNNNSPLKLHSNAISQLFKEADTYTEVKALVEEWNKINKSKYTFRDAKPLEADSADRDADMVESVLEPKRN